LHFKSVLLKRHFRDTNEYNFGKAVAVTEVNNKIPAEVLFPFLGETQIVFMDISAIVLHITNFINEPIFLYMRKLFCQNCEEQKHFNSLISYYTIEEFKNRISKVGLGASSQIIELE
jgi:hypothetical protein